MREATPTRQESSPATPATSNSFTVVQQPGSEQNSDTWVMSPSEIAELAEPTWEQSLAMIPRERYVLQHTHETYNCQACGLPCPDEVAVCTGCGKSGHIACLQFQFCGNYPFCDDCFVRERGEYQRAVQALTQQEWERNRAIQLQNSYSTLCQVLRVAVSVGGAAGTAAATVAVAATASYHINI